MAVTGEVRIIASSWIWGCWEHFMCHHELWPTSVSHPFSFLNSYLGLAGRKHYQKMIMPIFGLVLQNFPIPGYFPDILFFIAIFSPYFLQVGLLLQYVALFQSGNYLSLRAFVNWCRVAVSNKPSQHSGCPHFLCLFFNIFLNSIVACRLCVIYVKEDNDSNV